MRKRFYIGQLKEKTLVEKLIEASNLLHKASLKGTANFIITSPSVANKIIKNL